MFDVNDANSNNKLKRGAAVSVEQSIGSKSVIGTLLTGTGVQTGRSTYRYRYVVGAYLSTVPGMYLVPGTGRSSTSEYFLQYLLPVPARTVRLRTDSQ